MLRRMFVVLAWLGACAAMPAQALAGEGCPNEALRIRQSATSLPDCRAYEQVSPIAKNNISVVPPDGSGAVGQVQEVVAAQSGEAFMFESQGGMEMANGAEEFTIYRSSRSSGSWVTSDYSGPQVSSGGFSLPTASVVTPSLEWGVLGDESLNSPVAPPYHEGFYLVGPTGDFTQLGVAELGETLPGFGGVDISADGKRVIFGVTTALTNQGEVSQGAGSTNLYEWVEGQLSFVGFMPDGSVAAAGSTAAGLPYQHPYSYDGSHIFFATNDGQIYMRANGGTAKVSAPVAGVIDPNGSQSTQFWWATPSGSYVFFTGHGHLTADATTGSTDSGNDLYRYDTATGELIDLSVDNSPSDPAGAEVGPVVGVGDDGRTAYFLARGQLDGVNAPSGRPNLYVWHDGTVALVATLDESDHLASPFEHPVDVRGRVTPDGRYVAFESVAALTSYDNHDAVTGAADSEVYLYDSLTASLRCVSCRPDGGRSEGGSRLTGIEFWLDPGQERRQGLSSDGRRVFFDSDDKVVAADANSATDVYEYEEGGVSLISSGRGRSPSYFAGASADGDNAFIWTKSQLVAQDEDELGDIYDVRIDGGIVAQNQRPIAQCQGEDCRAGMSGEASQPYPASASFVAPPQVLASRATFALGRVSGASRALRSGLLTLALTISDPGHVSVTARATRGRHARVVAFASRSFAHGGKVTVGLRLSKAALRALRRRGRLIVRLVVAYSGAAGHKQAILTLHR